MPIVIKDLNDGIGVSIKAHGVLADDEFASALRKHLTQDPVKFKKYRYSLADYTEVSRVEISSETIAEISKLCVSSAKVNPHVIHADVVNQDLVFGLARMAESLRDLTGWESMIFRSIEDAEIWIHAKLNNSIVDLL